MSFDSGELWQLGSENPRKNRGIFGFGNGGFSASYVNIPKGNMLGCFKDFGTVNPINQGRCPFLTSDKV